MPAVTAATRLRRTPDLPIVQVNGETVMLNLTASEYVKVDAVGLSIWNRLDGVQTVQELVDGLTTMYSGDRALIEADVLEFLNDFLRRGLLQVCD